ncbi:hypothetical protein ONO12_25580, partial [Salmonella enterica subsp. enterica serovar Montevideo]|nr:hypothetical protein [Salmonella enterica subsp. enterica serovar Montevideo]
RALISRDHLVICNGGGGVPVVEKADGYHGIEAVIDKDLSAALLLSKGGLGALMPSIFDQTQIQSLHGVSRECIQLAQMLETLPA